MKTEVLPAADPGAIHHAADVLRHGGLVAFPTDTVYGVGALAFNSEAVERLYPVKGRSAEKAIAVLIASPDHLPKVAADMSAEVKLLAAAFWPGALTLVVAKRIEVPKAVSPTGTVGVRVPDHPVTLTLLRAAGPLAVTSANRSGEPNTTTAGEVLAALGERIDLLIDGGRCPGGVASTVIDCTTHPPMVLRAGPITEEMLRAVLGE